MSTDFEYGNGIQSMDFPSKLTITTTINTSAGDKTLGNIVVADIPAGAQLKRRTLLLVGRSITNTNGTRNDLNLAGTEHIQLKKSGGTFIDAIELTDGMLSVDASTLEGSFVLFGDIDLTSEVDGNGTYEVQWEGADATLASLVIRDLYTVLRIYFV